MEKQEFTYIIEPGGNGGYIWLLEGKQKEWKKMLTFYKEEDLIEALKQYRKSSVFLMDDTPVLMKKGKRLAEKLGLDFQHP